MGTKISLLFKDTGKEVSFDLEKNTVFYGVNGRGKTRVFRAIKLLHELVHKNSYQDISEIISSLNLGDLRINRTNYLRLFSEIDDIGLVDQDLFVNFTKRERGALSFYLDRLIEIQRYFELHTQTVEQRKIVRLIGKLETIVFAKPNIINDKFSIRTLNEMFSDLNLYLKRLKNTYKNLDILSNRNNLDLDKTFFEIEDVQQYLKNRLAELTFQNNSERSSRMEEITKRKDEIVQQLKKNKVNFITTEKEDCLLILDKIREHIVKINEEFLGDLWNNKKTHSAYFERKINRIRNNETLFNQTLEKYENISMKIDSNGICHFSKNNSEIDLHKLSSGENRLISIFLNIIFSEDNILLIDEPELSLSLNYQSKIIGDLMKLASDKVIMIATHAPFVFDDFIAFSNNEKIEV